MQEFTVRPQPDDPRLTRTVAGIDQEGQADRDRGRHRAAADPVSERPRDRHDDDDRRPPGLPRGRLSAQPEHAAGRGPDHRDRLRRRARDRRRPHRPRDRFRGQAKQEDADLGLRPGHRVRRSDGEVRRGSARSRGGAADLVALRADPQDQHRAEPLSRRGRDPWLRVVRRGPAAALHGGCRPAQRDRQDRRLYAPEPGLAGRQDLLYDRPADLGDGDQDGADGHPDPDLALGVYRLGRRSGAAGRV